MASNQARQQQNRRQLIWRRQKDIETVQVSTESSDPRCCEESGVFHLETCRYPSLQGQDLVAKPESKTKYGSQNPRQKAVTRVAEETEVDYDGRRDLHRSGLKAITGVEVLLTLLLHVWPFLILAGFCILSLCAASVRLVQKNQCYFCVKRLHPTEYAVTLYIWKKFGLFWRPHFINT